MYYVASECNSYVTMKLYHISSFVAIMFLTHFTQNTHFVYDMDNNG